MATEHDPSALDASIQPGGVPRHASARERKGRGLKPFLSDLKAEVQNQLSRAESQVRTREAGERTTQVIYPAGQAPQIEATPEHPQRGHGRPAQAQQAGDDGAALASAALANADHAGAEAAAARTEAAAARAEAATARSEAATAQATATRAAAQLQGARAEIEAAHEEFGALRTEFDAARERARQHILYAWIGAGAAGAVAITALVLAL